jgi:hypothetical protein
MMQSLRDVGATVVTFTMPDISEVMPLARLVRRRLANLNERLRETCASTGAVLMDLERQAVGRDARLWHEDRLHANSLGHERIAAGLAHHVGIPGHAGWNTPLPPRKKPTVFRRAREEARWARRYLLPWVARHARGQSTGHGRQPKRPEPHRFP